MKATIDEQGNIQVNLIDLLENMDDEAKQQAIEHFAWQSPIWHELVQGVCQEYAAESFNGNIFKLRQAFFQSEDAPEALRQTIGSLLSTIRHLQQRERAYTQALGKWRLWYERNMPAHRCPVPFPRWDLEWPTPHEVTMFMERNYLELAPIAEEEDDDAE
jgi:hypothetical protein